MVMAVVVTAVVVAVAAAAAVAAAVVVLLTQHYHPCLLSVVFDHAMYRIPANRHASTRL